MKRIVSVWPAVIVFCAGCAALTGTERNTSTPAAALIGHWRMTDGSGEVYFSSGGTYRFIDRDGNAGAAAWRVIKEDPGERRIVTVIRLKELGGEPVEEETELMVEGTFSADYTIHAGESIGEGGIRAGSFTMEYLNPAESP
ncbi:MAG: hypothetical protein V1789_10025 [PVC group bacterium]